MMKIDSGRAAWYNPPDYYREIVLVKPISDKAKKSTREVILQTIKARNQATVEELAEEAKVSPVTVRHHLNSLQAEGLLETESVRRKVGRPYYVYSLSEKADELFPKRYVRLSSRLLDEMKERFPNEVVVELFNGVVEGIVRDNQATFSRLSFEERLDFLVKLLEEEGYLARWELAESGYRFIEYSCPYISVGKSHSEVCTLDTRLILSVLQTEVHQHSCMLNGDQCCEFSIPLSADETRPKLITIS